MQAVQYKEVTYLDGRTHGEERMDKADGAAAQKYIALLFGVCVCGWVGGCGVVRMINASSAVQGMDVPGRLHTQEETPSLRRPCEPAVCVCAHSVVWWI